MTTKRSIDKITESAMYLFSTNGYDATSVHEICQHAGVSKGAFYYYFESKQRLFSTLVENWTVEIGEMLAEIREEKADLKSEIIAMAGKAEMVFKAAPAGFPILIEYWRNTREDPNLWAQSVKPFNYYLNFFRDTVEKGKQDGSINPAIDTEDIAKLLLSVSLGYAFQAVFSSGEECWSGISQRGFKLIFEGLEHA